MDSQVGKHAKSDSFYYCSSTLTSGNFIFKSWLQYIKFVVLGVDNFSLNSTSLVSMSLFGRRFFRAFYKAVTFLLQK